MIGPDPPEDDYQVVIRALKYAAQEAKQAGMPEVADRYLLTLTRLIGGETDLVPHYGGSR